MIGSGDPQDAASGPDADAAVKTYLERVASHAARDPDLTALQAGLRAAAELGLAHDTRRFANLLGLSHALVLRDLQALADKGGVRITRRDGRTMRTFYAFD